MRTVFTFASSLAQVPRLLWLRFSSEQHGYLENITPSISATIEGHWQPFLCLQLDLPKNLRMISCIHMDGGDPLEPAHIHVYRNVQIFKELKKKHDHQP